MITAAALCPAAPLLLPHYAGRVDAGAELREMCCTAISSAVTTAEPMELVLLAGTDRQPRSSLPPLATRVGRHLLEAAAVERVLPGMAPAEEALPGASHIAVRSAEIAWDATVAECRALGEQLAEGAAAAPSRQVLVVIGDGCARRGEKAPGHLDTRSFALDDAIGAALAAADWPALLAIDPALAADLLCQGRAALQVFAAAAQATPSRGEPQPLLRLDPFGVQYFVGHFVAQPTGFRPGLTAARSRPGSAPAE